jgi:hypothetical protein
MQLLKIIIFFIKNISPTTLCWFWQIETYRMQGVKNITETKQIQKQIIAVIKRNPRNKFVTISLVILKSSKVNRF